MSTTALAAATMAATIPPGYWESANGDLVPESRITEIDKLRHQVVTDLCQMAEKHQAQLIQLKVQAMQDVAAFVSTSLEEYGVKTGGEKGNVTLMSFDGRYKLQRSMQEYIAFGEQLMAAKALIDECVREWAPGANDKIMALITHAFQTDKAGKINTGRVLGLRRLKIDDVKWRKAMDAISDSTQTISTKAYVRFYKRDDATGEYLPISLDMASV